MDDPEPLRGEVRNPDSIDPQPVRVEAKGDSKVLGYNRGNLRVLYTVATHTEGCK